MNVPLDAPRRSAPTEWVATLVRSPAPYLGEPRPPPGGKNGNPPPGIGIFAGGIYDGGFGDDGGFDFDGVFEDIGGEDIGDFGLVNPEYPGGLLDVPRLDFSEINEGVVCLNEINDEPGFDMETAPHLRL